MTVGLVIITVNGFKRMCSPEISLTMKWFNILPLLSSQKFIAMTLFNAVNCMELHLMKIQSPAATYTSRLKRKVNIGYVAALALKEKPNIDGIIPLLKIWSIVLSGG